MLPFLDIVANLSERKLSRNTSIDLDDEHTIHLHASFSSRRDAIGVELCEGLHALETKKVRPKFQYFVRYSD